MVLRERIRETRSRVSRFKSALSPNSGDTINFQRRSSPAFEPFRDVDGFSATIEPNSLGIALLSGALTGDVAPMGSPLSGNGILRVHDPHSTSLVVGPSALRASAGS